MLSVAIFEDEPVLQMMWEDIADVAGFEVSGICASIDECRDLAADGKMDIAIVDVNLGGVRSDEIIALLEERGIPLLVCTGMDSEDLPMMFQRQNVLKKPFQVSAALQMLNRLAEAA